MSTKQGSATVSASTKMDWYLHPSKSHLSDTARVAEDPFANRGDSSTQDRQAD